MDATSDMSTKAQHLMASTNHSSHNGFRDIEDEIESSVCRRETSLLFVLLMLGTRKYSQKKSYERAQN